MEPLWLRQDGALCVFLLSEDAAIQLCSSTANTPRPVAAPWETEEDGTYLHLFTKQGTLQPLLQEHVACQCGY